jgi:hypothetical protein
MLPEQGVTGGEPFLGGTPNQKKEWLGRLHKMMVRARGTAAAEVGTDAVDNAIAAAGVPADWMTKPSTFTDQELLEKLLSTLVKFSATRSPIGVQNRAPTTTEAAVLTILIGEVESCYTDIVARKADQQIEKFFLAGRTDPNADKVREIFKLGVEAASNMKNALQNGNPQPGAKEPRILIDISGELKMRSAAALSSPRQMTLRPSFTITPASPADHAFRVNTLLHECMHVASAKITDPMYWPNPAFLSAKFVFASRINNADHFARVAIEYLEAKNPPSGGGGPPQKDIYKNIPAKDNKLVSDAYGTAQNLVHTALIYGGDAWDVLKRLHADPKYYDRDEVDWIYRRWLRSSIKLISQISDATLHERSKAPGHWLPSVTAFDLAAVEETIMDLAALIEWIRKCPEIRVVPKLPVTGEPYVLYVTNDDLRKRRDPQKLAATFVAYSFSRFNQETRWLRPGKLISDVKSMISEQRYLRAVPAKPEDL